MRELICVIRDNQFVIRDDQLICVKVILLEC